MFAWNLTFAERLLTTPDRNSLMPAPQEKLEQVTPKTSLTEGGDAEGEKPRFREETSPT
jgi:hypothetical protein